MKTLLRRLRRLEAQTITDLREYTHRINFIDANGEVDGSLVIVHGGPNPRSYELDRNGRKSRANESDQQNMRLPVMKSILSVVLTRRPADLRSAACPGSAVLWFGAL